MRGGLRCALLAGCLALAAPGHAQSPSDGRLIRVPSGQEVQLAVLNNTAGECAGLPVPEVRIAKAPQGGVIIIRFGQTKFGPDAPQCAGRQVPGLAVLYRPNAGFSGPDEVRIEGGFPGQPSQGQPGTGQTFTLIVAP
jgi:hypothetical protein